MTRDSTFRRGPIVNPFSGWWGYVASGRAIVASGRSSSVSGCIGLQCSINGHCNGRLGGTFDLYKEAGKWTAPGLCLDVLHRRDAALDQKRATGFLGFVGRQGVCLEEPRVEDEAAFAKLLRDLPPRQAQFTPAFKTPSGHVAARKWRCWRPYQA